MMEKMKKIQKVVMNVVLIVVISIIALVGAIRVVPEGHVGIKYRTGEIVGEVIQPGLTVKIPFIERIENIDIRENSIEFDEVCYTKDIQTVESLSLKVNYRLDVLKVQWLLKTVGISENSLQDKIIRPQVESVLKNEIGKYKAEELIASRIPIQESVEERIKDNLKEYGISITTVNIQNIDFDDSFETVIAEKVATEQKLLTAKTEAEKKQVEAQGLAEAQKIQADAQAYSINVVNEAMKSMDSDAYVKLQQIAMMKEKWNGVLPEVVSDSSILYGLNQE